MTSDVSGTGLPQSASPRSPAARVVQSVVCHSAFLGNYYGYARAAQSDAEVMLEALRREQWEYYLNECLPADKTILDKLEGEKPANRWIEMSQQFHLPSKRIVEKNTKDLVSAMSYSAVQAARDKVRQRRG